MVTTRIRTIALLSTMLLEAHAVADKAQGRRYIINDDESMKVSVSPKSNR